MSCAAEELVRQIKKLSSATFKQQMQKRFGINTQFAVGTPVTQLRKLAKTIVKPSQAFAQELWSTNIEEARILAYMLADPTHMTREQLNAWVKDLNSWDICDACALNLFSKVKNPLLLAERWMKKDEEFVRRAGFATLAVLAMPRAKTTDKDLLKMLPLVKIHAADPRPMVFKAVNWALRNIGKKNPKLTPHALNCAHEILDLYEGNRSAMWVAKNVLWELNSPAVKKMISGRSHCSI